MRAVVCSLFETPSLCLLRWQMLHGWSPKLAWRKLFRNSKRTYGASRKLPSVPVDPNGAILLLLCKESDLIIDCMKWLHENNVKVEGDWRRSAHFFWTRIALMVTLLILHIIRRRILLITLLMLRLRRQMQTQLATVISLCVVTFRDTFFFLCYVKSLAPHIR